MRSQLTRTSLYILTVSLLVAIALSIKVVSTLIAERYLYSLIIIGDVFNTLEVVELTNVLVFAILGMGFGLATALLPKIARQKTSILLLIIFIPLIFSASAMVKYNAWLEDVASKEKISFVKAESLTNSFLYKRVGRDGFLGFYLYTAQVPVLPTNQYEIKAAVNIEKKVKAQFLSLNKIAGIKQEVISGYLAGSKWMIRMFYFWLAVSTTVTHFHTGCWEIAKRAKPETPFFPPVAPRFKPRPSRFKPRPGQSAPTTSSQRKIPSKR